MSSPRHILILALVISLVLFGATIVNAQETSKQIALVVTYPEGVTHTEIVTVPSEATTADVLSAATVNVGLFDAGFGLAVCHINDAGCPVDDCFCDPANFWAYYHLEGDAWVSSLVGVGDHIPADRSVEGFAWSGFDENFNPTVEPPVKSFEEIEEAQQPPPAEIPEPVTLLLVGGGLAGLAWYSRRQRA